MKKKEFQEIKNKPTVELQKETKGLRDQLWDLKKDLKAGKIKNVREIRAIKKSIAQILTVIKQHEK